MAISHHRWTVYSRTRKMNAKKASAYSSRSAWGGDKAGTPERPYSAVAAAAYVSRGRTWDVRFAKPQDYSRKRDLAWSGILVPDSAPAWASDRHRLWTKVEEREDESNRKETAQLFRGTVIALPRELSPEQRVALVCAYVRDQFVSLGMVADINIHNPPAKDGGEQPHAHVMLTMRDLTSTGFGLKRRDWNDVDFGKQADGGRHRAKAAKDGFLHQRRASWADYVNAALEDAGVASRIDHRTLDAQGKDRLASVTMGSAEHAADSYEYVRRLRDEQERVKSTNFSRHLASSIGHIVMAGITGGPGAAVMAGLQEFGLVPAGANPERSIAAAVVRNVEQRFRHA